MAAGYGSTCTRQRGCEVAGAGSIDSESPQSSSTIQAPNAAMQARATTSKIQWRRSTAALQSMGISNKKAEPSEPWLRPLVVNNQLNSMLKKH